MNPRLDRRSFVALLGLAAVPAFAADPLPPVEVFKSPSCGCCGAWVDHL
jgi:hypothetical protein